MSLLKLITPTNIHSEKEKFFNSNSYHPIFTYSWENTQINQWLRNQTKYSSLFESIINQDCKNIVIHAEKVFATKITQKLIKSASAIVANVPQPLPAPKIEEISNSFLSAFNFFELRSYSVEIVNQAGFNFRPSPKKNKIVISKHLNLDYFSIEGEVKHELVHVIRYENGKFNNIKPDINYLPSEEGLASYCQDYTTKLGSLSLFQHAAEYLAANVALYGSLRDVFNFFVDLGFSKELAWQRGIRHKFGFIDTTNPGDIIKPAMYYFHQQKILNLTSDKKYRLFVGKISLNKLSEHPAYFGKFPIGKLKEFYPL